MANVANPASPVSPELTLSGDTNADVLYRRDPYNYITQLVKAQLPAVRNGIFNVHLTQGIVVQPHWHGNATETFFLVEGEALTSVFDPTTQKLLTYRIKPGQVTIFPQGWFHWIVALTTPVHALAIFDVPTPDIALGSDFLRAVPKEVLNRAYCVNEAAYEQAIAPMGPSAILGPPPGGCGGQAAKP